MSASALTTQTDEERLFSDVLMDLTRGASPKLTLGEIVDAFGERGFGALILMISLVSLFPWPPGSKAILGVPIILLSLELAFQKNRVWLPRWALRRGMSRKAYAEALGRVMKPIRFVERLSRPRLPWLTGEVADVVTGLACVFLAVMMALPVPFGDMLPGVTLMLLGLGVMQRDGIVILIGAAGVAICSAYLYLVWNVAMATLGQVGAWAASLF